MVMLKFVDGSGTDVTSQAKEAAMEAEEAEAMEARLVEDFHLAEEETDSEAGGREELEVVEVPRPKVQDVIIVLDEDEDGAECILEKVDSSPEKILAANADSGVTEVEIVETGDDAKVEVKSVKSLSFEEAFNRFRSQDKEDCAPPAESEVESDVPGKEPEVDGDFSADDENDESGTEAVVANSAAWSSLSLILEPQEQSPAKSKVKRKVRKSVSKATPVKAAEANKKKSPSPESSSKRYRRSSRMSHLMGEATDTDDQSPVMVITIRMCSFSFLS
jgi:hypothetical protein